MHNSWAGPAESLCALSKLLLTALDDAAMGIPVVHTNPSMCVQACTRVRTCAHRHTHFSLKQYKWTCLLTLKKKILTRHSKNVP